MHTFYATSKLILLIVWVASACAPIDSRVEKERDELLAEQSENKRMTEKVTAQRKKILTAVSLVFYTDNYVWIQDPGPFEIAFETLDASYPVGETIRFGSETKSFVFTRNISEDAAGELQAALQVNPMLAQKVGIDKMQPTKGLCAKKYTLG